jgi:hypothetical protein
MFLYEVQQRNEEIIVAQIFMVIQVASLYKSLGGDPGNNKLCITSYEL